MSGIEPAGPPVATVVITNYNYDRFLAVAVTSALDQTVPCQVVVVDDGSTDESISVLDELASLFPQLLIVRNSNGGQASAMNAGWDRTSTPYVLFLDADDRLVPEAVETVVSRFEADPQVDRCLFRLQWIDARGMYLAGSFPDPGQALPDGDLRRRVLKNPDDIPWQPTSGNAFRCSALTRFMPIPVAPYRISADHYLSNLTALTGEVAAIETTLGEYRIHGENADHRSGFDLERARSILVRTEETRSQLINHGRALGLKTPDDPDGFVSLTNSAMRLTSFRVGNAGDSGDPHSDHPYLADERARLLRSGLRAAAARSDLPLPRRAMAMAWILALGIAPRSLIKTIAAKGLTR
ncbi:MAG: glycosyltransferase family 2 protein [Acidimicrobiales bacterium]